MVPPPPPFFPITLLLLTTTSLRPSPDLVASLVATNLGPLVADDFASHRSVDCSLVKSNAMECQLFLPHNTACASCRQLRETFAQGFFTSTTIELDCTLPERYLQCDE